MKSKRGTNTIPADGAAGPAPRRRSAFERLRHRAAIASLKAVAGGLGRLAAIGPVRHTVAARIEKIMRRRLQVAIQTWALPPKVADDMLSLGLAATQTFDKILDQSTVRRSILRKSLGILLHGVVNGGEGHAPQSRFAAQYGCEPPGLLVLSPTNACNLRCKGCYADSGVASKNLAWPVFDRVVSEASEMWGSHFMVLTGGEPLAYRSEGKGVLDLAAGHKDMIFMMYTNGTLIDDRVAARIARLGNLTPAISVEGLKERTDWRRGAGTFDRVCEAMKRLKRERALFGISLTATCENADEILSDRAMDFYFGEMGVSYAWIFHYMPIGRAPSLKLLPTPEQRLMLWKRSWELVKNRGVFVADFWNGGTISKGCISAGRPGGYLALNSEGMVSPCVFLPYSPVNINQVYASGGTLNDAWAHPFFGRIREWQVNYGYDKNGPDHLWKGNWMMPCPIRDHHAEFRLWLDEFHPDPLDENARAAMSDPDYRKGMIAYNRAVAALLDPVWASEYLQLAPGGQPAVSAERRGRQESKTELRA
jgi:MoaA/NifB/PqqE/SkfB family radical SAM enzyme